LNTDQIDNFGADYAQFYADMQNGDVANLDFNELQVEIGQNPGNQNNSPYFVHMVAGLGSGLFYFDANGCPVNPLDADANRFFCQGVAPANNFDPDNVVYALDRIVENTGVANASSGHPLIEGGASTDRAGALVPGLAGPLGGPLLNKLANPDPAQGGLILDSWIDADGAAQGNAADFIQ
jgi:hypothetical protein